MNNSVIDLLKQYCQDPPADLVNHFISSRFPSDDELSINLLPLDEALDFTKRVQDLSIMGRAMRLVVLDDANDSNPFCYVTAGPASGLILHLLHDDGPEFGFKSIESFTEAIEKAIEDRIEIWDLPLDNQFSIDQNLLTEHIRELLSSDEEWLVEKCCVYIQLLDTSQIELVSSLAEHEDFFVREALAMRLKKQPNPDARGVCEILAGDQQGQVAFAGKRALEALD